MIRVQGPMITSALAFGAGREFLVAASAEMRAADDPVLLIPVVLQVDRMSPSGDESWPHFKERVANRLGDVIDRLHSRAGVGNIDPLFAGNALATALTADQLAVVAADPHITIEFAELDPLLPVVAMDEVVEDIGLPTFRLTEGGLTGQGVRVAVLDSGVDGSHPALTVAAHIETCGESTEIPGSHGTHCAGIIASRDSVVPGIAPGVELMNIKVLRANGTGRHTSIAAGIDRALDLEVDILSMSLGFNHLPQTVSGGHGWTCADGMCPLCLAVDNAVTEGAMVVVAAGNEHLRCEQVRAGGAGLSYDTELACPGQARQALTVGALRKGTHAPAAFSSSGPSAFNLSKPDLAAPGVDVLSTIPVPRDQFGVPDLNAQRSLQFGVKSGTSMATPVVAGVCALLIEAAHQAGSAADPATIRQTLLSRFVQSVGGPPNVLGAGRLRLA